MKTIDHKTGEPLEEVRDIGLGEQIVRGGIVLAIILAVFAVAKFT